MRNFFSATIALLITCNFTFAATATAATLSINKVDKASNDEGRQDAFGEDAPNHGYEKGSSLFRSNDKPEAAVDIDVQVKPKAENVKVTLQTVCGDSEKTTSEEDTNAEGKVTFNVEIKEDFGASGDLCRFVASAAVADKNAEFPFMLGCLDTPCMSARGGGLTVGRPFVIDNAPFAWKDKDGNPKTSDPLTHDISSTPLQFTEVSLEDCTASQEPELFAFEKDNNNRTASMKRVYPAISGSKGDHLIRFLRIEDGGKWGKIDGLFYSGDVTGCSNLTIFRESVVGSNNITPNCPLQLNASAAVTTNAKNNIQVKLGPRPANVTENVATEIFVSSSAGNTWVKALEPMEGGQTVAFKWGDANNDVNRAAASDNTRNRALVKLTGTDGATCWHMLKGH